jgi:hypothetical protein
MENIASLDPFPGRPQKHAAVVTRLFRALVLYLERYPAPDTIPLYRASYQLPGDSNPVMTLDISVVFATEDEQVAERPAPYMPPLVMAVRIPEVSPKLLRQRAEYYLTHGTEIAIIVLVERQIIAICEQTYIAALTTTFCTQSTT